MRYFDTNALYANSPDESTKFTLAVDHANDITIQLKTRSSTDTITAYKVTSIAAQADSFESVVIDTSEFEGGFVVSGRVENVSGTMNVQPQVLIYRGYGYNNGSADEGWEVQNLGTALTASGNLLVDISTETFWQNQPSRYVKLRFVETGAQQNTYYVHLTVTSKGV